jgi:hypothetical protein
MANIKKSQVANAFYLMQVSRENLLSTRNQSHNGVYVRGVARSTRAARNVKH